MSCPDYGDNKPIITPAVALEYRRKIGDSVESITTEKIILTYQPDNVTHLMLLTKGRGRYFPQYGFNYLDNERGIYLCSPGPTAASIAMEELIALGSKTFINVGVAGGLQNYLKNGDIVVCTGAIGDDGVSDKYLGSVTSIETSKPLTDRLKQKMTSLEIDFWEGRTWTTSTIYRETVKEVEQYKNRGVLTVDLETAALAAVAKYRKVEFTGAFVVSDLLADGVWDPGFHLAIVREKMNMLHEIAYSILNTK